MSNSLPPAPASSSSSSSQLPSPSTRPRHQTDCPIVLYSSLTTLYDLPPISQADATLRRYSWREGSILFQFQSSPNFPISPSSPFPPVQELTSIYIPSQPSPLDHSQTITAQTIPLNHVLILARRESFHPPNQKYPSRVHYFLCPGLPSQPGRPTSPNHPCNRRTRQLFLLPVLSPITDSAAAAADLRFLCRHCHRLLRQSTFRLSANSLAGLIPPQTTNRRRTQRQLSPLLTWAIEESRLLGRPRLWRGSRSWPVDADKV